MNKPRIMTIVGTRPELIKLSPVLPLLEKQSHHLLIHTGQHFDESMRAIFFRELKLKAAIQLKSNSQGKANATMIAELCGSISKFRPHLVVVQGDTNSAMSGAIAANLSGVPIAHVEAGCRSGNLARPEEKNRRLIDKLANLHFAPDSIACANLANEGISKSVYLTGNTAIEAIERNIEFLPPSNKNEPYLLLTLHRAENVDDPRTLRTLIHSINRLAEHWVIVFPIHPRTRAALMRAKIPLHHHILCLEPQGYLSFLKLLRDARAILTDSGGIQEEAAGLNIPCFVLREETEWQRLVNAGKVCLLKKDGISLRKINLFIRNYSVKKMHFDRGASKKIVRVLKNFCRG